MTQEETIQRLKDEVETLKRVQSQITVDHDLIIKMDGKLDRVIIDVRELKDNLHSKVTLLEVNKYDKEPGYKHEEEDKKFRDAVFTNFRTIEKRLVKIETWGTVGLVLLGIIQFFFPYIINIFFPNGS